MHHSRLTIDDSRLTLVLFIFIILSCSPFRRSSFLYHENGIVHSTGLVVPKKYNKTQQTTDSAGNEQKFFYYSGGRILYFAHLTDSLREYQYINLEENIPRMIYGSVYMKGIDSSGLYWRENRDFPFRSGYRFVKEGRDWIFDSSLNYFSVHRK
jgi:hypothetical protein